MTSLLLEPFTAVIPIHFGVIVLIGIGMVENNRSSFESRVQII